MAWRFLDERFKTSQQPSQEILNTILTGPPITLDDSSSLTEFSQACAAALCLKESGSLALSPLDNQTTQESIFDRLSLDLNRKWFKYRIKNEMDDGPVPFHKFAQWIQVQSKVELGRRGKEKLGEKSTQSITRNQQTSSPTSPETPRYPSSSTTRTGSSRSTFERKV